MTARRSRPSAQPRARPRVAASVRWTDRAVALYAASSSAATRALPWASGVSDRLRERLLRQLRKLGPPLGSRSATGRKPPSATSARSSSTVREEFYRRLMIAYQQLNRRGDALLAYQRCRRTYQPSLASCRPRRPRQSGRVSRPRLLSPIPPAPGSPHRRGGPRVARRGITRSRETLKPGLKDARSVYDL